MTELGSRLRMAREEKGLSLDELQAMTKIQKKYLIGIEEGEYSVMPGKFYARAFIKQYAEAVGLEPDQLFEEFKSDIPPAYEDDLPEQLSRVQSRGGFSAGNSKVMELLPKIGVAVFVIAVLFVIWLLVMKVWDGDGKQPGDAGEGSVGFKQSDQVQTPDKPEGEDQAKDDKKEDAAKGEEEAPDNETTSQTLTAAGVSGDQTTYTLTGTDSFALKMNVVPNGESYVRVRDAAGKTLLDGTLGRDPLGESQELDLSGQGEISIRIGSTPNLELFVNGEKLQYEQDPATRDVQTINIQFTKTE